MRARAGGADSAEGTAPCFLGPAGPAVDQAEVAGRVLRPPLGSSWKMPGAFPLPKKAPCLQTESP